MVAKGYGLFILVCSMLLFPGGLPAEAKDVLTVSAASSLKDAFEEIAAAFEARRKGTKVLLNFASSGRLRNQIAGGAPVDVFASAAMLDMNMLAERGYVEANTINRFAANRLVLIVPRPPTSSVRSFEDLHSPAVQRIAVGNPRTVPVGRYAQELLQHDGLSTALRERLVLAENVRQVPARRSGAWFGSSDRLEARPTLCRVPTGWTPAHDDTNYQRTRLDGTAGDGEAGESMAEEAMEICLQIHQRRACFVGHHSAMLA